MLTLAANTETWSECLGPSVASGCSSSSLPSINLLFLRILSFCVFTAVSAPRSPNQRSAVVNILPSRHCGEAAFFFRVFHRWALSSGFSVSEEIYGNISILLMFFLWSQNKQQNNQNRPSASYLVPPGSLPVAQLFSSTKSCYICSCYVF